MGGLCIYICPSVFLSKNSHCLISVFSGKQASEKSCGGSLQLIRHQRICTSQQHYKHLKVQNAEKALLGVCNFSSSKNPHGAICDPGENSFETLNTPGINQEKHLRLAKVLNQRVWGLFKASGRWDWREGRDSGLL